MILIDTQAGHEEEEEEEEEELRDGLGGSVRLAVIDGGTHASNVSHPAEVSAELLTFLQSLD
ncbi:MAG: hypothetical protein ACRDNF_19285 [Streptosporangiaceae bacterium]